MTASPPNVSWRHVIIGSTTCGVTSTTSAVITCPSDLDKDASKLFSCMEAARDDGAPDGVVGAEEAPVLLSNNMLLWRQSTRFRRDSCFGMDL